MDSELLKYLSKRSKRIWELVNDSEKRLKHIKFKALRDEAAVRCKLMGQIQGILTSNPELLERPETVDEDGNQQDMPQQEGENSTTMDSENAHSRYSQRQIGRCVEFIFAGCNEACLSMSSDDLQSSAKVPQHQLPQEATAAKRARQENALEDESRKLAFARMHIKPNWMSEEIYELTSKMSTEASDPLNKRHLTTNCKGCLKRFKAFVGTKQNEVKCYEFAMYIHCVEECAGFVKGGNLLKCGHCLSLFISRPEIDNHFASQHKNLIKKSTKVFKVLTGPLIGNRSAVASINPGGKPPLAASYAKAEQVSKRIVTAFTAPSLSITPIASTSASATTVQQPGGAKFVLMIPGPNNTFRTVATTGPQPIVNASPRSVPVTITVPKKPDWMSSDIYLKSIRPNTSHIKANCRGCSKQFKAYVDHKDSTLIKSYEFDYYVHCIKGCKFSMENFVEKCDKCNCLFTGVFELDEHIKLVHTSSTVAAKPSLKKPLKTTVEPVMEEEEGKSATNEKEDESAANEAAGESPGNEDETPSNDCITLE